MKELIEWRAPSNPSCDIRRIILHFEGKEYLLGIAQKVHLRRERFYWEVSWRKEIFDMMDEGYFALRTGAPLEPYQEKMNAYIITNLWRIVRRLKEIEGEQGNQA